MGAYRTIVADPPWSVSAGRALGEYKIENGRQVFGPRGNEARRLAYPSLQVDAIKSMPIASIADENAHLYLWTINKYIEDAYAVARAWGFRPSTMLVWAKNPMGGGLGSDAYGISTEYCLFARRGAAPAAHRVGSTWFNWKRPYKNGAPQHSAKPAEFFGMVERVSPGPMIELFARTRRDGWAAWGNEVVSDIDLTVSP